VKELLSQLHGITALMTGNFSSVNLLSTAQQNQTVYVQAAGGLPVTGYVFVKWYACIFTYEARKYWFILRYYIQ